MDLQKFTRDGRYLMLALDQRESFRKILKPLAPEKVTDEEIITAKREIIEAIYDQFSAILVDPHFGLPALQDIFKKKASVKPYLLCIEKSGYSENEGERVTTLEYTVEKLKSLGASGIKLNLEFNPFLSHVREQIELTRGVYKDCKKLALPFFLEIVTYQVSPDFTKQQLVIESVKTFLKEQIIPDVFKLEYPGDPNSAKSITQLLSNTPWILLTLGIPYEIFKNHLGIACLQGASGFLAGRSVWQEFGNYQGEERINFLQDSVTKRFQEISSIVLKNSFLV